MEEQGRALLCAPYFSSCVLAAAAILHAAEDDQKASLLPAIASGQTRAALAVTEPNGRWDATGIQAVASRTGGRAGGRLVDHDLADEIAGDLERWAAVEIRRKNHGAAPSSTR